jgi:DNA end-binding protein Ku
MPRPIWKGFISFGLVMIPVTLYSGESPQSSIDLDMLDKRDHERIRYQRVNEKTGREVAWSSIVKGYQYEEGKYVVLTPDDFKLAAKNAVRGGIEILDFVDQTEISPAYFEKPYFLEPGKHGEKGYVVLRETLKKSGRAGIAKTVIQTREHLAALLVEGNALQLITMRFADELRDASELKLPAGGARGSTREIEMAERLVQGMTSSWDPSKYHDTYREALTKIIKDKTRGPDDRPRRTKTAEEEPPESYNIMDLLQKSLEGKAKPAARRASAAQNKKVRRAFRRKAG